MNIQKENENMHEKPSIFARILRFFFREKSQSLAKKEGEIHLEPKYWPEVQHFMKNLDQIVESHTIQDENIKRINQRVIDYIEDQINKKGQVEDINARYNGLNTLADRILSNNLNKLVGLKEGSHTADFSNAVKDFKHELHEKKQAELDRTK